MKGEFDESILQSFMEVSPYLSSLLDEEVSFALTDKEKFIGFLPGENIRPDITVGETIKEGSSTHEALKTKKVVCKIVPEQVFGFKLKSIAVPLKGRNGEIVGVVSVGKSLKRQEEILNLSKNLSMALNQISSASSEVSGGVQNTAASNEVILREAKEAFEKTKNTDEILSFIKNIEKQTNLLGLNASIEAARAGEFGKGFSVVASEIRKLSNSSNESIVKINQVIKEIQASVEKILYSIKEVNETSHNQAAVLEELTASIQELNSNAESLKEIASNY